MFGIGKLKEKVSRISDLVGVDNNYPFSLKRQISELKDRLDYTMERIRKLETIAGVKYVRMPEEKKHVPLTKEDLISMGILPKQKGKKK
jgi:hypothetical protein